MSGQTETESLPVFPHFVTFYSYKGGVGRTLALANTALLLARYGRKVLVVDADLEAPGLIHLPPFDAVPKDKMGFVDLLEATLAKLPVSDGGTWLTPTREYTYPLDLSDFTTEIPLPENLKAHKAGRLAYIPAGSFTPSYAQRVEALHIGQLYESGPGATVFRELKSIIAGEDYDYVIIDSRTGWSDIGGMCTRDLADTVVLVCGLNKQNISGTRDVMHAIEKGRGDETPPGVILAASPVPNSEEEKKAERVAEMTQALGRAPDVQLFYHPLLALVETPFVGRYEDSDLFPRYEKLTEHVQEKANDHTEYWLNKAVAALNEDKPELCEQAFQRAARTEPDNTLSWLVKLAKMIPVNEGRPLRDRRLVHGLITELAENHEDENLSFGAYLGNLGRNTGDSSLFEEAAKLFQDVVDKDKNSSEGLLNWGSALYELARRKEDEGLFQDAFAKYDAALKIKPDFHEALNNWGNALFELAKLKQDVGLYQDAFAKYDAALKIKPDLHEALDNWGTALLELFHLTGRVDLLASISSRVLKRCAGERSKLREAQAPTIWPAHWRCKNAMRKPWIGWRRRSITKRSIRRLPGTMRI